MTDAKLCECAAKAIERGFLYLDPECDPKKGGGPCKELKASNSECDKRDK